VAIPVVDLVPEVDPAADILAAEDPAVDLAEDHKSHYKYNCCLGRN